MLCNKSKFWIYLFFTNISKERLMKCWNDIKKRSLMTLPNKLNVFLTKEIGFCSCMGALPFGTPPSSPVKTCVVHYQLQSIYPQITSSLKRCPLLLGAPILWWLPRSEFLSIKPWLSDAPHLLLTLILDQ